MNLRDKILAVDDIKIKPIDLSEFKLEGVFCKTMDSVQFGEWQNTMYEYDDDGKVKQVTQDNLEIIVVQSICDEKGELVFTMADIKELQKHSGKLISKMAKECMAVNGFGEEEVKAQEKK